MKALIIPLLALLTTTAASGQLFDITLTDRITEPTNSTGMATDGSLYSGSPITAHIALNQEEVQLIESGFSGTNTTAFSRFDGAKLSITAGTYGHSTVNAGIGLFISPTSSTVSFHSFSNTDTIGITQSAILGSLFEDSTEIPLATDPFFLGADSVVLLETSAFAGEYGRLSEFENLLFNDPRFLETFSKAGVSLRYRRNEDDQESSLTIGSPPIGTDSPTFEITGTAVPEPSTYGLFGALGLVALIGHRRFRPFKKSLRQRRSGLASSY